MSEPADVGQDLTAEPTEPEPTEPEPTEPEPTADPEVPGWLADIRTGNYSAPLVAAIEALWERLRGG